MKMTRLIVLASGLILAAAATAAAQGVDPKVYVDLNIAGQTQSTTVATSSTFSLFGETGGTNFSQTVGKGLVFDGGAGYFVRKNVSVGVAVSFFTRSPAATVSVATPDPLAFNSFTVVSASPKLKHTELGTHIKLAYLVPLGDNAEVSIFAGPSIVRLSKEIATATVVNGAGQIAVETQSGTGFGAHGGLDFSYRFTPRFGGGIFVRYLRAQVDLPAASGVKVGGFQGGLGVRVRF
jgi:hypothetical protein